MSRTTTSIHCSGCPVQCGVYHNIGWLDFSSPSFVDQSFAAGSLIMQGTMRGLSNVTIPLLTKKVDFNLRRSVF
eukprot:scaffold387918_cov71-Attheya_sp.AAC.1